MRLSIRAAIGSGAFLLAAVGAANAVPVSSLHPNNVGISSFGFSFDAGTNTITLRETWTGTGPGIVQITGLENTVQYTVVKIITNSSGTHWTSFAQELLDPAGFADDTAAPAPAFAPPACTSSNDTDGLSFAQGSGIPRTSIAFGSTAADELGGRGFLDFFGGTLLARGGGPTKFGVWGVRGGGRARRGRGHCEVRVVGQQWGGQRCMRRGRVPQPAVPARAAPECAVRGAPTQHARAAGRGAAGGSIRGASKDRRALARTRSTVRRT